MASIDPAPDTANPALIALRSRPEIEGATWGKGMRGLFRPEVPLWFVQMHKRKSPLRGELL
jgi:hypothetical protein